MQNARQICQHTEKACDFFLCLASQFSQSYAHLSLKICEIRYESQSNLPNGSVAGHKTRTKHTFLSQNTHQTLGFTTNFERNVRFKHHSITKHSLSGEFQARMTSQRALWHKSSPNRSRERFQATFQRGSGSLPGSSFTR